MKTVKRTTVVFLADLAISNLVQGIASLVKAALSISNLNTSEGCMFVSVVVVTTSGTYISGVFFVYLDLYLSLRKMSVGRAVISTKLALGLMAASWLVWTAFGATAYGMRNPDYVYDEVAACLITSGVVRNEYTILLGMTGAVCVVVIMVLHVLTYRLLKKARKQLRPWNTKAGQERGISVIDATTSRVVQDNRRDAERSKWVKRNDIILKMILTVLVLFIACWCPLIFAILVWTFCAPCTTYITNQVMYVMYLLIVVQYNSNGVIYLIRIKEFQNIFKKVCCRCCPSRRRVDGVESGASVRT